MRKTTALNVKRLSVNPNWFNIMLAPIASNDYPKISKKAVNTGLAFWVKAIVQKMDLIRYHRNVLNAKKFSIAC